MSLPKVLLLVNSDPSGSGVGELFLRDLVKGYPAGKLVRYSTVQSRGVPSEACWLGFRALNRYVPSSSLPVQSTFYEWAFRFHGLRETVDQIEVILKQEGIQTVWCVLSSGPVIRLADSLARRGWRVISTVLDDPRYFAQNQRLDRLTKHLIFRTFGSVLFHSGAVSVIGENMRAAYLALCRTDPIIIRHGIDDQLFQPWQSPRFAGEVKIAFAGSLYAKRTWNALVSALESVEWKIAGNRVTIKFIGTPPRSGVKRSPNVSYLGRMEFAETLAAVRSCSLAYLPYWFESRRSIATRTSFPGKLSAYAACGIPVFFHGPLESSVTPFLQRFPFGLCCHSLAPKEVLATLSQLVSDSDFDRAAPVAQRDAFFTELNLGTMRARFFRLLEKDDIE